MFLNSDSGSYYINRVGSANDTFEKTWNCVATDSFNSSVLFFVFCCYCVVVVFVVVVVVVCFVSSFFVEEGGDDCGLLFFVCVCVL